MINSMLSLIAHISALWCAVVVAGFVAKMAWLGVTMGWGLF